MTAPSWLTTLREKHAPASGDIGSPPGRETKGRSWNAPGRPRVDKQPTLGDKFRWEAA